MPHTRRTTKVDFVRKSAAEMGITTFDNHKRLVSTTSLTACFVGSVGSVAMAAGQDDLWFPAISTTLTTTDQQTLGSLELFMPVLQSNDSVFFVDMRLDPEHFEDFRGSYGGGIRHIVNNDLMIGGYGYFNNEVFMGTPFQGITLGAEFITPHWDGHINYQIALDNPVGAGAGGGAPTVSLVGNNLVALIDSTALVPMDGVDAELGYTITEGLGEGNSLRASGGVYHYFSKDLDFSFTGAKAGIEFEHKFGDTAYAPRLTFGAEIRHDTHNKTNYAVQARLRIPLGGDGLFSNGEAAPEGEGDASNDGYLPGFGNSDGGLTKDRINSRVRATGIVTAKRGSQTTATVIDAATNNPIGQFFFADDANTAGAGTFADPTTLDSAITNAGAAGYIVALENGLPAHIETAGATLLANQSLVGGGTGIAVLVNGTPITFTLPGSAGTINGTNAGNNVITLGNDNLIRNVTITGGNHGIAGNGIANGTIDNVSLTAIGNDGIRLENTTGTQTISNFSINGTGDDGIFLDGVAMAQISNGSIDGTNEQGIDLRNSNANLNTITMGTNAALGAEGLLISNSDATSRTVSATGLTIGSATPGTTGNIPTNALAANSTGTGRLSLNLTGTNILRSTGSALVTTTGATADILEIAFGDLQAEAGTLVPAIDIQGDQISSTAMSTIVRSGGAITVFGNGTGGGIRFNNTRFDADAGTAGNQQVAFGAVNIGQGTGAAQRVQGDGLSFLAPTGDLQLASLNIFNNLGTGLEVDTKIGGTTFNLNTLSGTVDTTNGSALFLDPLTGNINLASATSTNATALGASSQTSSGNGMGLFIDGLTSPNANPALNIGTVNVTGSAAAGIGIQDSANLTFGTVNVTLSEANSQGVDFAGTSGNVTFGTTTIGGVGSSTGQTGIDFSGATLNDAVSFNSVAISGSTTSTDSVGVNLTGVQGNQMVGLGTQAGPSGGPSSSISGLHRGVVIDPTAAIQFTFGDGESGSDTGSTIDVNSQAGAFTVDAGSGSLAASFFDFDDVTFGAGDSADFPSAPVTITFVSTAGGLITAGTNGLSEDVNTITVAAAEAQADTDQTFVFVGDSGGSIDVVGGGTDGFTLDAGQVIDSFNDGNSITIGTVKPSNISGNFGVTGSTITANNVTAVNSTVGAAAVISATAGNAIRNLDVTVNAGSIAGVAFSGTTMAASVTNVAISGAGQVGLSVSGNTAAITLADVDISGTSQGITETLGTAGGSLSADAASSITNTTGEAIDIEQSAANFTFAGTISETDSTGGGIDINQLTGSATFSGGVTLTTGSATAVDLTNSSGGTVSFTGGLAINTTTGTGFNVSDGGTLNITGASNTVLTTTGRVLNFDNTTIGASGVAFANLNSTGIAANSHRVTLNNVTATGTFAVSNFTVAGTTSAHGLFINASSGTFSFGNSTLSNIGSTSGAAIRIAGSTGTYDFGNTIINNQFTAGDGVNLSYSVAATTNINFNNGLDIDTSTGVGFRAIGSGSNLQRVSVTNAATETVNTTTGQVLDVQQVSIGSAGLNFDSVASSGVVADNAVDFSFVHQNTVNIGSVSIAGTSAGGEGISIAHSSSTFDFGTVTIDNTSGDGILLNGSGNGAITFDSIDIDNTTGIGFHAISNANAITVNGGSIGSTTSPASTAVEIAGGDADISFAASLAKSTSGHLVRVSARSAGTATFSGNVAASGSATGLNVFNNTGGTVEFSGASKTLNTGANTAIALTNNTGTTVNFSGGGLDIDTTTATGIDISGTTSGTISVSGTGNTIDVTNWTGINIAGTSSANYSFANLTVNSAPGVGINVNGDQTGALTLTNVSANTSTGVAIDIDTLNPSLTITGSGNSATSSGTGRVLNIDGGIIGASGLAFANLSTGATGSIAPVTLSNLSGPGTLSSTTTNLAIGASTSGIVLSGTIGADIAFGDVDLAIGGSNTVAINLSSATINSTVSASDLDITATTSTGTIGVNITGTTGSGTVRLGDTDTNGGNTVTLGAAANMLGIGVQVDGTTNLSFIIGDGDGAIGDLVASNIHATTAISGTLPTNGTYNFRDINFNASGISNIAGGATFFVFDEEGTNGAGTFDDPGTAAQAAAASVNVLVAIDNSGVGGSTIDLSSVGQGAINGLVLDDNQALISLMNGESIDAASLGIGVTGGAPANFLFTNVGGSSIITGSGLASGSLATVTTTGANDTITFAGTGAVQNITIANGGTGHGLSATGSGTENILVRSATIGSGSSSANAALFVAPTGGAQTVEIQDVVFQGTVLLDGSGAGTVSATATGTNTITAASRALSLANITIGGAGMTFGSLTTTTAGNSAPLSLDTVDGGALTVSNITIAGTLSANGIDIRDSASNVNLSNVDINGASGSGIALVDNTGTFTLSGINTIDSTNAAGVTILNTAATISNLTLGASATGTGDDITGAGIAVTNNDATSRTVNLSNIIMGSGGTGDIGDVAGDGIVISSTGTGVLTFGLTGTNTIRATGQALEVTETGAGTADNLLLSIDGTTFESGAVGAPSVQITGQNVSATTNTIGVRSFSGNTVIGNSSTSRGGILFTNVDFDSDGAGSAVTAGTLTIGQGTGSRVSGDGLSLINVTGDLGFTTLNIFNDNGTGLEVDTKSAGTTFNLTNTGGTVDTTNGPALFLDPLSTNLTFGNVSSVNSGTTGVHLDTVSESVGATNALTITNLTISGATAQSILVHDSTGDFVVTGGTITNTGAGIAVQVGLGTTASSGSSGDVSIGANINSSGATGGAVQISERSGGTVTISGNLTDDNATGGGINVFRLDNGVASIVNFTGSQKQVNTASTTAVSVTDNINGTINFTGGGLDIDTTTQDGFQANDGGTVTVSGSGNTITTTSATALNLADITANLLFDDISISALTGDTGISIVRTSGTVTATGGTIDFSGGGTAIGIGTGATNSGGSATINLGMNIDSSGATGRAVTILNLNGANVTLSGNLTDDSAIGGHIEVSGAVNGSSSVTFSGSQKQVNTGSNTAVNVSGNTNGTVNFTNGGLDIDTTSGAGLAATGGGTISVQGSTNTIATTGGQAVNINGVTIGASGVTFQSINQSAGATAISLTNTGSSGGFTITGDGGSTVNGSGGTISALTGDAIVLNNTMNFAADQLNLSNIDGNGVLGVGVNGFRYTNATLTTIGDADPEDAFNFDRDVQGNAGLFGTALFQNLTITGFGERGIDIVNEGMAGVTLDLDIIDVSMSNNNDTFGEDAIRVQNEGNNNADVRVSGGTYDLIESDVLAYFAQSTGTNNVTVTNVTSTNGGGADNFPNGGGLLISGSQASTTTFDINNSNFSGVQGNVIIIAGTPGSGQTVTMNGSIVSNILTTDLGDGIDLDFDGDPGGGSSIFTTILVSGNTINFEDDGIGIDYRDAAGTANITIQNNNINVVAGTDGDPTDSDDGIFIFTDDDVGVSGTSTVNVRIDNNTFSGIQAANKMIVIEDVRDPGVGACFDITNNSVTSGSNTIEIDIDPSGNGASITQSSLPALSAANNSATVTIIDQNPSFNGTCTSIPLP